MCIGDSFDGAANMSGVYNDLQALLKQVRPSHVHAWCYAHVLNWSLENWSTKIVGLFRLFPLFQSPYITCGTNKQQRLYIVVPLWPSANFCRYQLSFEHLS
jgi:hypothetical protein